MALHRALPRALPRTATVGSALLAGVTVAALASPANAAPSDPPFFQASAAGTAATIVGGAVTSSPSAPTAVRTRDTTNLQKGQAAAVNIPGILRTGAVTTDSSTKRNATDTATIVTGHAKTASINLLDGVLTASAINTTSSVTITNRKVTPKATTTFTNLRIAGNPVITGTVAPNTTIEVPGVIRVVLNASATLPGATNGMAVGNGLVITLLGGSFANSTVAINPTSAQSQRVGLGYAPLGGYAVGAQVVVDGDSSLSSGPFGAIGMTDTGTGGETQTNTLASAAIPGIANLGTLTATANGIVGDRTSRTTMTSSVAGVNLLGGLITADALTSNAQVTVTAGQAPVPTSSVTFTNLRIAGGLIPLDVPPNTIIALPNIGSVAVRATATAGDTAAAGGLVITLSTAAFGLPAGATVLVGFSVATLLK